MKRTLITKCYPRKGVKVELVRYYNKEDCIFKHHWKVFVRYDGDRDLEVEGILLDKIQAYDFYLKVRRSLRRLPI